MIFNYTSGLKEDCGDISVNEVLDAVVKLSSKMLNQKKVEILKALDEQHGSRTITSAVDAISQQLCCPKSTVWMNINSLKEVGLITNGYGKPAKVTAVGRIVLTTIAKEKA